jgi:hypothetical protein
MTISTMPGQNLQGSLAQRHQIVIDDVELGEGMRAKQLDICTWSLIHGVGLGVDDVAGGCRRDYPSL